jgi:hypothetical protein
MARKKKSQGDTEIKTEAVEPDQDAATPGTFMDEAAEEDRAAAKAKHVDDGIATTAEQVDRMKKGLAYAKAVYDVDVKLTVLTEIADTAAAVREDARRAVRNALAERRNLQKSGN